MTDWLSEGSLSKHQNCCFYNIILEFTMPHAAAAAAIQVFCKDTTWQQIMVLFSVTVVSNFVWPQKTIEFKFFWFLWYTASLLQRNYFGASSQSALQMRNIQYCNDRY